MQGGALKSGCGPLGSMRSGSSAVACGDFLLSTTAGHAAA